MDALEISQLIALDNLHAFYTCAEWLRLRAAVLTMDHYECQRCKERGKYTRATTVHHVNHVRKHPELALAQTYCDCDGQTRRNLLSLCHNCHEEVHGYRRKQRKAPLTEERW